MKTRYLSPLLVLPLMLGGNASTQPNNQSPQGSMTMGEGMMGQGMMGQPGMMGPGRMMGSMIRHHEAMMNGVPEPYRSARNPLANTRATLARGAQVYAQNCAACHGTKGYGDGPAASQLSPRPADLAWLSRTHMVGDQYIYWTVAEGGQPIGSPMPAFKTTLSQRDMWAAVTYVRDGLPGAK